MSFFNIFESLESLSDGSVQRYSLANPDESCNDLYELVLAPHAKSYDLFKGIGDGMYEKLDSDSSLDVPGCLTVRFQDKGLVSTLSLISGQDEARLVVIAPGRPVNEYVLDLLDPVEPNTDTQLFH